MFERSSVLVDCRRVSSAEPYGKWGSVTIGRTLLPSGTILRGHPTAYYTKATCWNYEQERRMILEKIKPPQFVAQHVVVVRVEGILAAVQAEPVAIGHIFPTERNLRAYASG